MAIKFGPYCKSCAGEAAVSDLAEAGSLCRVCGQPGELLVDPFDQGDWEPEPVEPDPWAESEARWEALFGVSA